MPRVSIGVPVYNGERFIRQSVESLLAQTYGDFELVITDNASKDGTEEVCRELVKKDKRVRYVRNDKNLGGPGNFRRVFALCSGEFHKWSTADDYWDPTVIEKCVAVLDREPDVVLCYPKSNLVDASRRSYRTVRRQPAPPGSFPKEPFHPGHRGNPIVPCAPWGDPESRHEADEPDRRRIGFRYPLSRGTQPVRQVLRPSGVPLLPQVS